MIDNCTVCQLSGDNFDITKTPILRRIGVGAAVGRCQSPPTTWGVNTYADACAAIAKHWRLRQAIDGRCDSAASIISSAAPIARPSFDADDHQAVEQTFWSTMRCHVSTLTVICSSIAQYSCLCCGGGSIPDAPTIGEEQQPRRASPDRASPWRCAQLPLAAPALAMLATVEAAAAS